MLKDIIYEISLAKNSSIFTEKIRPACPYYIRFRACVR
jgi:hypothetical protein